MPAARCLERPRCSFPALPFLFGAAALLGLLPVLQSSGSDAPMEITRQPSLVTEGITASPPVPAESGPDAGHPKNISTTGHGKPRKLFPVLELKYDEVHLPFEITLWILLACLMKLGRLVLGAHTGLSGGLCLCVCEGETQKWHEGKGLCWHQGLFLRITFPKRLPFCRAEQKRYPPSGDLFIK